MNHAKIVAFNWKLHPGSLSAAQSLGRAVARASTSARRVKVIIFPPFPFVPMRALGNRVAQGVQNCFWEDTGPYTGQVSPSALRRAGIDWVIIGHSETRKYNRHTDIEIGYGLRAALSAGLRPLFCVGDSAAVHKQGFGVTMSCLRKQISGSFKYIPAKLRSRIVLVYEPVWAISSVSHGRADDPVHAARIISGLKTLLRNSFKIKEPVVLYGGSVNAETVSGFLGFEDIDGFLVGAASLKASQVSGIIKAVENN